MSAIRTAALMGCASLLAVSSAAFAQDAAPAEDEAPAAEIIVTGSRVIKNGDEAPQPLTAVQTGELLRQTPTTVADGLNALPVFAGSRGPSSSVTTTGNASGGNGAANQLSLRGLGSNRNLILFDGQRLPTALFNGVVDVDIVPDTLLERVDVVTGGVSAVYGSDAISGVVNFVPMKKFTGYKAEAQAGISGMGDAAQRKIAVAGGWNVGERGHLEASFTNFYANPVFYRTDRSFAYDYAYGGLKTGITAGTAGNPYVLVSGARNSSSSFGGKITSGILNNQNFTADGVLSPFNYGTVTGSSNLSIGGDGYYNNGSLGATQRSNQGYARFDYDLTDSIRFHTQGIVSIKNNTTWSNYAAFSNYTIKSDNAFLSDAIKTQLSNANQSSFTMSKVFGGDTRLTDDVHTEQFYVNSGLDGKLAQFDWGLDVNYGRSTLHNRLSNNINNQKLAAALDSVKVNGVATCRINADSITTNDDASCVALNPFGPTAASQAAMNYVLGSTNMWSTNDSFDMGAHISGDLFDFGAGPIRAALSGQYRVNGMKQTVDYSSTDTANCSGLSYVTSSSTATTTSQSYANNCIPTGATNSTTTTATGATTYTALTPTSLYVNAFAPLNRVSQRVKEAALEVAVPLLKDSAVAKSLEVSGAVRYADYNTTGNTWVWKVGGNWQVTNDLRLRGTISRDFRAPTLNDLYQPTTVTITNNADKLTGATFLQSRTQGNPNLKPEVSHTWTAGLVYKPSFVPGLSFAIDYYNIKITDAIQSVSGFSPAIQDACTSSGGTSPYCALQPRPNGYTDTSLANAPYYWVTQVLNFARVTTDGVDAEMNYATELFGRPASLRTLVSYQPNLWYGQQPGTTAATQSFNAAGTSNADGTVNSVAPKWRVNASVHVEPTEWLSVDVRERWRSAMRYNPILTTFFAQRIASAAWTDLSLTFKLPEDPRFQLFFNVSNLFDKTPPAYQTGILPGQGYVPGDDYIGRYFTTGVRLKF
ncbi:TonB-dependent receptor [Novosphingobium flavum]|uniref:TonB-dependent receptor n=1 Tax=Novosphingobium flavum TaxID=1778672 RepID=A0A7X1KK05_9SPHN|nr:TonB-dependent receptor [Novosphingobium flavum]MBC2664019.1 TonB-dependent receptor [Novosphingobium flavum]